MAQNALIGPTPRNALLGWAADGLAATEVFTPGLIQARKFDAMLPDALQHQRFVEAYPMSIGVKSTNDMSGASYSSGASPFAKDGMYRTVKVSQSGDDPRSSILHELQHSVQEREGFARGGSPEALAAEYGQARSRLHFLEQEPEFKQANAEIDAIWNAVFNKGTMTEAEAMKREAALLAKYPTLREQRSLMETLKASSEDGYGAYKRLAGEAEARAVQARMNMTAPQRREVFPLDSYDVPTNQLIVRR